MKNIDILEKVAKIEQAVYQTRELLDDLLASLREDEVIASLNNRKNISTAKLQKEFGMGYAAASMLLDKLLDKGLIKKGKGLVYGVINK